LALGEKELKLTITLSGIAGACGLPVSALQPVAANPTAAAAVRSRNLSKPIKLLWV
jgi:hypothetical protein